MNNEEIKKRLEGCYMDIRELIYHCEADDYDLHSKLAENLESLRDTIEYVKSEMESEDLTNILKKGLVGDDEC